MHWDDPKANRCLGVGGAYVNAGYMFIRFSKVKFMKEVEDHITSAQVCVICDITGHSRSLRCSQAHRDLGSMDYYKGGCILERRRYLEDRF